MLGAFRHPFKTNKSSIAFGFGLLCLCGCVGNSDAPPTQPDIDAYLSAKLEAVKTADYKRIRVDSWSYLDNPVISDKGINYTFRTLLSAEKLSPEYFDNRIEKVREMHCDAPEDIRMMNAGVEYSYTVMTFDDVKLGTITANTEFCKTAKGAGR